MSKVSTTLRMAGSMAVLAPRGVVSARRWKAHTLQRLNEGSQLVQTRCGVVEYAERGSRIPVLLLHGTPGGYDQALVLAQEIERLLGGSGLRFIMPSRPGYLRTPLAAGRTPAEQADLCAALLDALQVEQAAVVGVSGGGPCAIEFAARHAARTPSLVLWAALSQAMHLPIDKMPGGIMATAFGDWLMLNLIKSNTAMLGEEVAGDPALRDFALQLAATVFPGDARKPGLVNDAQQYGAMGNLPLHAIQSPTLIVHGTHDTNAPFAQAEYARHQIPGARLLPVEGGTHLASFGRAIVEEAVGHIKAHRIERKNS
jgi:pimeloyl-ACP methyl ester carboxylesterase